MAAGPSPPADGDAAPCAATRPRRTGGAPACGGSAARRGGPGAPASIVCSRFAPKLSRSRASSCTRVQPTPHGHVVRRHGVVARGARAGRGTPRERGTPALADTGGRLRPAHDRAALPAAAWTGRIIRSEGVPPDARVERPVGHGRLASDCPEPPVLVAQRLQLARLACVQPGVLCLPAVGAARASPRPRPASGRCRRRPCRLRPAATPRKSAPACTCACASGALLSVPREFSPAPCRCHNATQPGLKSRDPGQLRERRSASAVTQPQARRAARVSRRRRGAGYPPRCRRPSSSRGASCSHPTRRATARPTRRTSPASYRTRKRDAVSSWCAASSRSSASDPQHGGGARGVARRRPREWDPHPGDVRDRDRAGRGGRACSAQDAVEQRAGGRTLAEAEAAQGIDVLPRELQPAPPPSTP